MEDALFHFHGHKNRQRPGTSLKGMIRLRSPERPNQQKGGLPFQKLYFP